jgi:hypothetical protein
VRNIISYDRFAYAHHSYNTISFLIIYFVGVCLTIVRSNSNRSHLVATSNVVHVGFRGAARLLFAADAIIIVL